MAEDRYLAASMDNKTGYECSPQDSHLEWGKWLDSPVSLTANSHGELFKASGAAGSATGTEGWIRYAIGNTGATFTIHWDIPYTGANTFWTSCSTTQFGLSAGSNPEHDNGCSINYTLVNNA